MDRLSIPIKRLTASDLGLPAYQTAGSAGMDLPAAVTTPVILKPGERRLIPCGFAMAIPEGIEAQIRPRSGLANRFGITVLNAPGTIDSDYRGEVCVLLINHGADDFTIARGDRVAQLVISPVRQAEWETVDELPGSARGAGGFGHTGHTN